MKGDFNQAIGTGADHDRVSFRQMALEEAFHDHEEHTATSRS
jgi:hypothetical protein